VSDLLDDLGPWPAPKTRFGEVAARLDECLRRDVEISLAALGDAAPPDHLAACAACREIYRERRAAVDLLGLLPVSRARLAAPRSRRAVWTAAAAGLFAALLLVAVRAERPGSRAATAAAAPPAPSTLTRFTSAFEALVGERGPARRAELETRIVGLGRAVWPMVVSHVSAPDPETVDAALSVLERWELAETVRALESRLDPAEWRTAAIYRTLARLDLPGSSEALARGLSHPARRRHALAGLRGSAARSVVPVLLSAYRHLPEDLVPEADRLLREDGALARRILGERIGSLDFETLAAVAPLAEGFGFPEARWRLLEAARHPVRAEKALEALARMGDPGILRSVLELPRERVRGYLRERGERAAGDLHRLAAGRDPEAARTAIEWLAEFNAPESAQVLASRLRMPALHRSAIRSLARLPGAEAARILLEASRTSPFRDEIARSLGRKSAPEVLADLLRMARDARSPLEFAASALSGYPRDQVVPTFIAWLNDPAARLRAYALLRELTGERGLGPTAGPWERWWRAQVPG
jgi:hypothetical protein